MSGPDAQLLDELDAGLRRAAGRLHAAHSSDRNLEPHDGAERERAQLHALAVCRRQPAVRPGSYAASAQIMKR